MAKNGDAATRGAASRRSAGRWCRCLNDLGMIVDVSAAVERALAEVLSLSRAPVIASHSAVRARVDVPRN